MFEEIEFERIKRLPKYVFAAINEIKLKMRQDGEDVIDFSMGNPDGPTPSHIIDKLCEAAQKPKITAILQVKESINCVLPLQILMLENMALSLIQILKCVLQWVQKKAMCI